MRSESSKAMDRGGLAIIALSCRVGSACSIKGIHSMSCLCHQSRRNLPLMERMEVIWIELAMRLDTWPCLAPSTLTC